MFMENAFVVEQVREWLPLNLFDARQYNYLVHLHVENDIHLSPWDAYENLFQLPEWLFFLKNTHARKYVFAVKESASVG